MGGLGAGASGLTSVAPPGRVIACACRSLIRHELDLPALVSGPVSTSQTAVRSTTTCESGIPCAPGQGSSVMARVSSKYPRGHTSSCPGPCARKRGEGNGYRGAAPGCSSSGGSAAVVTTTWRLIVSISIFHTVVFTRVGGFYVLFTMEHLGR